MVVIVDILKKTISENSLKKFNDIIPRLILDLNQDKREKYRIRLSFTVVRMMLNNDAVYIGAGLHSKYQLTRQRRQTECFYPETVTLTMSSSSWQYTQKMEANRFVRVPTSFVESLLVRRWKIDGGTTLFSF